MWLCFLTYGFFLQPAFLVAIFATKESKDVQNSNADNVKQAAKEASFDPQGSRKPSLVDALLLYLDRVNDLINRYIFVNDFNSGLFGKPFWIANMVSYIRFTF